MKNKKLLLIICIVFAIIAIDQITKVIIEKNFADQYVGNNFIGIEVTNNTGLAFGFNEGNIKNIGLTIFALVVIFNFTVKQFERLDKKTIVAVSFVLGGGFSNLIDRFFRGSVLDFIKIFKFPNFNIADSFIVIGWMLIVVFLVIYTRNEEK